jgi:hypothetical protein
MSVCGVMRRANCSPSRVSSLTVFVDISAQGGQVIEKYLIINGITSDPKIYPRIWALAAPSEKKKESLKSYSIFPARC